MNLAEAVRHRWPQEAMANVRVVRAPGRVNLIGEHTDYNLGFVLPVAVSLELTLASVPSGDRSVELLSLARGETLGFDLDGLSRPPSPSDVRWIDYPAAVAWALIGGGATVRGIRGMIDSQIPVGAGLSSSAALGVACALALMEHPTALDPPRIAQLVHRADNEFVGIKSGVMDQLSATMGRAGHALLIDCRSTEITPIRLLEDVAIVVCDSGVRRRLVASAYNRRRAECEQAVDILRRRDPLIRSLRDIDPDRLEWVAAALPERLAGRCRHVVEENGRVLAMARALEDEDVEAIGRLMGESQASLRDLYQVSSPELDALVGAANQAPGVVGARLTGAGFGGCTVNLVRADATAAFAAAVERSYGDRAGRRGKTYVVEAVDGAGEVPIGLLLPRHLGGRPQAQA